MRVKNRKCIRRLSFKSLWVARILLPLQVGDELHKNKKNTYSIARSMV